jgi:hypothetical protein
MNPLPCNIFGELIVERNYLSINAATAGNERSI